MHAHLFGYLLFLRFPLIPAWHALCAFLFLWFVGLVWFSLLYNTHTFQFFVARTPPYFTHIHTHGFFIGSICIILVRFLYFAICICRTTHSFLAYTVQNCRVLSPTYVFVFLFFYVLYFITLFLTKTRTWQTFCRLFSCIYRWLFNIPENLLYYFARLLPLSRTDTLLRWRAGALALVCGSWFAARRGARHSTARAVVPRLCAVRCCARAQNNSMLFARARCGARTAVGLPLFYSTHTTATRLLPATAISSRFILPYRY